MALSGEKRVRVWESPKERLHEPWRPKDEWLGSETGFVDIVSERMGCQIDCHDVIACFRVLLVKRGSSALMFIVFGFIALPLRKRNA